MAIFWCAPRRARHGERRNRCGRGSRRGSQVAGAVTNLDGSAQWTSLYDPATASRCMFVSGKRSDVARYLSFPLCQAAAFPAQPRRAPRTRAGRVGPGWVSKHGWPATRFSSSPDLTQVKPLSEVGALGQPVHAGSPRSPDGRSIVRRYQARRTRARAEGVAALAPRRSRGGVRLCRSTRLHYLRRSSRSVACVRDGRLVGMSAP